MLSSLSSTIITVFDIVDVLGTGALRAARFVREEGDGSRIGIFVPPPHPSPASGRGADRTPCSRRFHRAQDCSSAQTLRKGKHPQAGATGVTSIVRRLSAILKVYPPNRSTRVIKMSREAAPQGGPLLIRCGLRKTAISTIASGRSEAIPSITPMKRPVAEGSAKGIEMS